jgi:wyosine [tRNA(Phe)-imidazoG37] synthetase (radical SAM superfamily)
MAKYIYGPVPSRRLGQSLGVSPIPEKTCNYNCIYCQLGKTSNFTNHRRRFFNPKEILREISETLKQERKIDYITFVGEGEPTLSKDLGLLIDSIKNLTNLPIAVITNGGLFSSKNLRQEIRNADVIIPSFDAGNSKLFRYINRPHKELNFRDLVIGLKKLRQEFNHEIWIEVMLLKGINDSKELLEEINGFLDEFQPDKIQINIPSRPPAEEWIEIPDSKSLNLAKLILQSTNILPLNEVGLVDSRLFKTPIEAIFFITKRHPLQYDQALDIIRQFNIKKPETYLNEIITKRAIKVLKYRGRRFIYRDEGYQFQS